MTTELDRQNAIAYADEKGEIRGEAKGILKGKLAVAKAMIAKGLDIQLIIDVTGFSEEKIQELAQSTS